MKKWVQSGDGKPSIIYTTTRHAANQPEAEADSRELVAVRRGLTDIGKSNMDKSVLRRTHTSLSCVTYRLLIASAISGRFRTLTMGIHTRSALFEGTIHPTREDEFFHIVMTELMPVWQAMPGQLAVRVLRTKRREDGAPSLVLVQEVDYPSAEAVIEAEASPVRARGAPVMEKLMTMFDGTLRHVVYERLA